MILCLIRYKVLIQAVECNFGVTTSRVGHTYFIEPMHPGQSTFANVPARMTSDVHNHSFMGASCDLI